MPGIPDLASLPMTILKRALAGAVAMAGLAAVAAPLHADEWQDQAVGLHRQMLELLQQQLRCLDRRIDGLKPPTLSVGSETQVIADQWELNLSVEFDLPSDGVLLLLLQPSRPMTLPVVLDGDPGKCQPLFGSGAAGTVVCTAALEAGRHRWGLNGSAAQGVDRFDIASRRIFIANEPTPPPPACTGDAG